MLANVSLWAAPRGTDQFCAAGVRASSRHRAASSGGRSPALTAPFCLRTPPRFPQSPRPISSAAAVSRSVSSALSAGTWAVSPPFSTCSRKSSAAALIRSCTDTRSSCTSHMFLLFVHFESRSEQSEPAAGKQRHRAQSQQWRLLDWRTTRKLKYLYCTVENMEDETWLHYK